ncbi:MAG TPA: hypothetical protein VMB34_24580 [Acetobacteraceae bacterium]|nr:hypothetical protein [Acetobacteraceae bacterium]
MPVDDNGPMLNGNTSSVALAPRAHWPIVEWRPNPAPDSHDSGRLWRDIKARHLACQMLVDADDPDRAVRQAVGQPNAERMALPLAEPQISA